jgi:hypothetical protein
VEGRAILWERCEEKRSSRPPLWWMDIRFESFDGASYCFLLSTAEVGRRT